MLIYKGTDKEVFTKFHNLIFPFPARIVDHKICEGTFENIMYQLGDVTIISRVDYDKNNAKVKITSDKENEDIRNLTKLLN